VTICRRGGRGRNIDQADFPIDRQGGDVPRIAPNVLKRYGLAIALAGAALAIRARLPVAEGSSVYQLPLVAVAVAAWLGGRGPGWLGALVVTAGSFYFFIPPSGTWQIDTSHRYGFGMFVALEVLLIEFSASRWRVLRALAESERRFRSMAEAIPQMLWFESIEPRAMLYASRRFEQIWGRSLADLQREPGAWLEAICEEDRAGATAAYARWIGGEQPGDFDATFRIGRPDGGTRIVHAHASLLRDEEGRACRACGIAEDITEAKRAEEHLSAARAELTRVARLTTLGQLAASIAHEVNQPLGAMVANAAACEFWLAAEEPQPAKARTVLKNIVADGQRASAIIGRIRAQLDSQPTRKEPVDINQVIHDAVALAGYELQRNGIAIDTALAAALPRVEADRIQLQQVMLNLIVNGMEATMAAGGSREILIASEEHPAGGVAVTVKDSGTGLDAENAARLFDPFYTTKATGMGMGLAICRSTIEAQGGRIWAEPNAPRGAVFRFTLPAVSERIEVKA
jgi:PAS domain S-box-containing protein